MIETLYDREIYWIKKLNTKSPNGYNLHDGGRGGCLNPSDELRQKLSDAKKRNRRRDKAEEAETIKDFALNENEIEDIFDLIESENPDL